MAQTKGAFFLAQAGCPLLVFIK